MRVSAAITAALLLPLGGCPPAPSAPSAVQAAEQSSELSLTVSAGRDPGTVELRLKNVGRAIIVPVVARAGTATHQFRRSRAGTLKKHPRGEAWFYDGMAAMETEPLFHRGVLWPHEQLELTLEAPPTGGKVDVSVRYLSLRNEDTRHFFVAPAGQEAAPQHELRRAQTMDIARLRTTVPRGRSILLEADTPPGAAVRELREEMTLPAIAAPSLPWLDTLCAQGRCDDAARKLITRQLSKPDGRVPLRVDSPFDAALVPLLNELVDPAGHLALQRELAAPLDTAATQRILEAAVAAELRITVTDYHVGKVALYLHR